MRVPKQKGKRVPRIYYASKNWTEQDELGQD